MPPTCFITGTIVLVEDGEQFIENLEPNRCVWSIDNLQSRSSITEIRGIWKAKAHDLIRIEMPGEFLVCTPEHPFWTSTRGWVVAGLLLSSDVLVSLSGSDVPIMGIERIQSDCGVDVYNLHVGGEHTFVVGHNRVIVHNKRVDW